jgi:hypothetical protein
MSATAPSITTRIVAEQRKRLVASIMRSAEQSSWWRKLTGDEQVDYRDDVLSSINVFYELVRDIVKVSEDDGIRNDYAIKLIEKMHADQQVIVQRLNRETAPVKITV